MIPPCGHPECRDLTACRWLGSTCEPADATTGRIIWRDEGTNWEWNGWAGWPDRNYYRKRPRKHPSMGNPTPWKGRR